MSTQKILKLVITTIISVSMATNIQAGLIWPTITTTTVLQTPRQIYPTPYLFSSVGEDFAFSFDSIQRSVIPTKQYEQYDVIPWDFSVFAYEANRNWNLPEPLPSIATTPAWRPVQTEITANKALSYIPFTETSLRESRSDFARVATDIRPNSEWEPFYNQDVFCTDGISPLSIQSSLNHIVSSGTELARLYEREFVAWPFCHLNDFFYDYSSTFFDDSDRFAVTYRPEGNISAVAVPEPATLVLLGFGILIFVGKRR